MPISNATDILHNFYMAQVALVLEHGGSGYDIFTSLCTVQYILPRLAYEAEKSNVMGWKEVVFEQRLSEAVGDGNQKVFGGQLPEAVRRIKRQYGLNLENQLSEDNVYQMLINTLCLMRSHSGVLSFQHQIYRDYLAAVYLFDELCGSENSALWKQQPIQAGVAQYLRHMPKGLWGDCVSKQHDDAKSDDRRTIELEKGTTIGFSKEDYLVLQTGEHIYQWSTITYDRVIESNTNEAIKMKNHRENDPAHKLYKLLEDSEVLGSFYAISDDRAWLAVGFENGHLQVWNAEMQTTVAELSLGDAQIVSAAFSANGELAAITAGGTLVQLWNVRQQRLIRNLRFTKPIRRVRFPAMLNFQQNPVVECEASNGTFIRINLSNMKNERLKNQQQNLKIQKNIRKQLEGKKIYKIDMADNRNAVIQLKGSSEFYVWNHETRDLNLCVGHTQTVKDVTICRADPRYAASYSDERIKAKGSAKHLNGQKVVRVWAVRKGNCMQRLSTNQRTIKKLQFFTTNRIILAGFVTNGDIMLWELHNRKVRGEEWGHWDLINVVTKSPADPLECAVSTDVERFIGIYTDGTLFSRRFSGEDDVRFQIFPGIDLTPLRWEKLEGDQETIRILKQYQK